jgi:hypothetical protein
LKTRQGKKEDKEQMMNYLREEEAKKKSKMNMS